MKLKFFPPFRDEREVMASWGEARLIKYLDCKLVLKGGSKEDRQAAHEWISLFWHEAAVVREVYALKAKQLGRTEKKNKLERWLLRSVSSH
jgi:hypothetical protein